MQEISELELLDVYSERCSERKDGSVGSTGNKIMKYGLPYKGSKK